MIKIFDITLTIENGMPVWPGDAPVEVIRTLSSGYSYTRLSMGAHSGTHVDTPIHFIEEAASADSLDLDVLLGPARVIHLPGKSQIDTVDLASTRLNEVSRLLIALHKWPTVNAYDITNYSGLTEDAARYLIEQGIRLIGIDGPSVDLPGDESFPAHHALLEAGVAILEGIDLTGVPAGDYELLCLPLKIKDTDGAPARVVLRSLT